MCVVDMMECFMNTRRLHVFTRGSLILVGIVLLLVGGTAQAEPVVIDGDAYVGEYTSLELDANETGTVSGGQLRPGSFDPECLLVRSYRRIPFAQDHIVVGGLAQRTGHIDQLFKQITHPFSP